MQTETPFEQTSSFESRLQNVRVLISDVDGIFTDGRTWQNAQGQWRRVFSVRDTLGIRNLRKRGVLVIAISSQTGVHAEEIQNHMTAVGVDETITDCDDKAKAIHLILKKYGLTREQCAYVGVDSADQEVFEHVGARFSIRGSAASRSADFVTIQQGGDGAIMEICGRLLKTVTGAQDLGEAFFF